MKKIEATSFDKKTTVAIWDMADLTPDWRCPAKLAISLNLVERTARFFLSKIASARLCDVEISVDDFKRIFPTRCLPGMRGCLSVNIDAVSKKSVLFEEVLEGLSWSHNTLEGSLGPAPGREDVVELDLGGPLDHA